jgi:hypothetical protein
MARRLELPDGTSFVLADWIKSRTTMPRLTDEQLARWKAQVERQPASCLRPNDTLVSHETILGQPAVVIREPARPFLQGGRTIPAGRVTTSWRAPALACEELQFKTETTQPDGSLKLKTASKAIRLELRDPDPELMDPGANYVERSPSEIIRIGGETIGLQLEPGQIPERKLDIPYFSGRR